MFPPPLRGRVGRGVPGKVRPNPDRRSRDRRSLGWPSASPHPACGIGAHVPVWDSRTCFGDTDLLITNMERGKDLARGMGQHNTVLLRGHGCVVVGANLKHAVLNAIYFKINASLVLQSMQIGDDITYLSEGEIELTKKLVYADNSVTRMWDY